MKKKKENNVQPSVAQFIHAEGYTVSKAIGICGEVTRERGYCPHITNQRTKEHPPLYLQGDETYIRELGQEIVSKSKTIKRIRKRNGKELKQKIQDVENVFLAGVTTIKKELGDDPAYLMAWSQATHEYLKEKYKDHLKAVVLHSDESHYDIHFIVVNSELNPSLDADWFQHRQNKDLSKKEVRRLENDSLRAFQDEYFEKVASEFGLDRVGEQKRPRSERPDYLAKKNAELLEAQARIRNKVSAEELKQRFDKLTKELEKTEEKLAKNREEINNKNVYFSQREQEINSEKQEIEMIKSETEKLNYTAKELARKEKLYTESVIKKEKEAKQIKEQASEIIADAEVKAKKIIDKAIITSEKSHQPNLWQRIKAWWNDEEFINPVTELKAILKRRYEDATKPLKEANTRLAGEKEKDKELIKAYQLKFGPLDGPKNEATLEKTTDISHKPKDDGEGGSGGGSFGM